MWCRVSLLVSLVNLTLGQEYFLPGDVVPNHYDAKFLFDLDPTTKFIYYGVVDILVTAKSPTSKIVLHAQEYNISNDKIKLTSDQDSIPVSKLDLNDTYNFLTLDLDETLEENKNYTLTIPFSGLLKNVLTGVYISSYVDKKTKTEEYLIATCFEAIFARKGFPCFDEPKYKATFHITIGHNREFNAVSNMPLRKSYRDDNEFDSYWSWDSVGQVIKKEKSNFVWDEFENSVPMSTYLVAFVVSKFVFIESPPELSRTKFRIWARKDAISQTKYASVVGPKVLSHFEKWFNVSFPLPKQDMIAVPDFLSGAMEHWGLITCRETSLLYDKKESSFLDKQTVAGVIAHELAHQWFGNLVTMKWWSDLWLNEGFATFVASIGEAAVEPSWGSWQSHAINNIYHVLFLDTLESSHPVLVQIDNPKKIFEMFDEISYRKGSTLIRMMTMFLGEDIFQKAINQYLKKYSYQNAEQDDLWQVLTDVNQQYGGLARNITVKEVMDTWTTQTGYPLLTVKRDYSQNTLTVTQKRYRALGAKAQTSVSWWVPLNVLCENEVGSQTNQPVQWLGVNEGTINEYQFEHGANMDEWLLFNKNYIAPYRVNYDQRNWELLINTLTCDKFAKIPEMSRVQLIGDAFALAWTNQLDYKTALKLANYLQRETEYLPIDAGLKELNKIENLLKRSSDYGTYQKFVRKLITERYRQSGGLAAKKILNGDDLNSVKMQVTTSSWACRMKVPGCEENAIEMFQQWMDTENPDKNNPIPLDLRGTVYCVAISRGSVVEWQFLLARQQRSNVAAANGTYRKALACTREVWILAQYFEWTVSGTGEIRSQDSVNLMSTLAGSTVGYYIAKDFLYTRVRDIFNMFKAEDFLMKVFVEAVLSQITTQRELDEFQSWRAQNEKYLGNTKIEPTIEQVKVNIEWLNRNGKHVVEKMRELSTELNFLSECVEERTGEPRPSVSLPPNVIPSPSAASTYGSK